MFEPRAQPRELLVADVERAVTFYERAWAWPGRRVEWHHVPLDAGAGDSLALQLAGGALDVLSGRKRTPGDSGGWTTSASPSPTGSAWTTSSDRSRRSAAACCSGHHDRRARSSSSPTWTGTSAGWAENTDPARAGFGDARRRTTAPTSAYARPCAETSRPCEASSRRRPDGDRGGRAAVRPQGERRAEAVGPHRRGGGGGGPGDRRGPTRLLAELPPRQQPPPTEPPLRRIARRNVVAGTT